MIQKSKADQVLKLINSLNGYELRYVERHIREKLCVIDDQYIDNTKLTNEELNYINQVLRSH